MLNEMEKVNLVATTATLAALVFPVLPQMGSVLVHLSLCLGMGGLITFMLVAPQPTRVAIRKAWWGFCDIVHLLAVGFDKLDRVLCKFNKGRNHD